jgi:hypothetical protein
MKLIIKIIGISLLITSCSKALKEEPFSIAEEVFYNTPAEIAAGANAIYTPLRQSGSIGALYTIQLETYSDLMYGRGKPCYTE